MTGQEFKSPGEVVALLKLYSTRGPGSYACREAVETIENLIAGLKLIRDTGMDAGQCAQMAYRLLLGIEVK